MQLLKSKPLLFLFAILSFSFLSPNLAKAESKKSHTFAYGYCTWYVANRNNFYVAYIKFGGDAKAWIGNSQAYGYKTKDRGWKPKKYSILITNESGWGHCALVDKVESSRFRVTEMNYSGWNKVSSRWIDKNSSKIKGFILTKKAIEQYQDGDKDDKKTYETLKKQYKKHNIWYDGLRQ